MSMTITMMTEAMVAMGGETEMITGILIGMIIGGIIGIMIGLEIMIGMTIEMMIIIGVVASIGMIIEEAVTEMKIMEEEGAGATETITIEMTGMTT